jgi:ABC-type Fe3+/spermidine/putrescine transport system ATPase subunit
MPGELALRLKGLTKSFGTIVAVDHVNLDIRRGEFLTLLGPSGSGKSTILLLVAGFEIPDGGDIYLDERSLSGIPPYKRKIGIVFQSYALFPHLSVFENIAFALRNLRWRETEVQGRVSELLSLVRLEGLEGRLPSQLSGGQQQRVAVARALAAKPSVLLLDEPLGALDRKLREHMLIEFRRLHRTLRTTMVYVTHDQEEALVMSDRVAILNHGQIIQLGSPFELYEHPADAFVADFLGDINFMAGIVAESNVVELDDARVAAVGSERSSIGARVRVAIRPERIAIGPPPDGWSTCEGRIDDIVYLGEATKYRVTTHSGKVIVVKQLNYRLVPKYEVGKTVTLSWHPQDCRIVEELD